MTAFSATDAALEGFRITRERPKVVLIWAVFAFLVSICSAVYLIAIGQDARAVLESELQKAQALHEEQQRKATDEHQQTENMLLTVESMDKGALEEYARKYDVELDKRLGIAKLRAEVSTLIEQFGVR